MATEFFHGIELAVLLATLLAVVGIRLKPVLAGILTAAGLCAFAWKSSRSPGIDLHGFWQAGQNVWVGISPYDMSDYPGVPVPLNPPTAFPLFALLAILPLQTCLVVWLVLSGLACLLLVWISERALRAEYAARGESQLKLDWPTIGLLTAAVSLSFSARYGLDLGQLAILTAAMLISAVLARASGRWLTAAICLAFATVKIGTMFPFLLLFLRPRYWKTLVAFTGICVALVLATTAPGAIPTRLTEMGGNIAKFDKSVNNYEYENPSNVEMFGIDHLLYRLGLRDRSQIRICQLLVLAGLGLWVAYEASPWGRLPSGVAVSLVALYAELFLYHRVYDAILLALPLVEAARLASATKGRVRILAAVAGVAVLGVMYLQVGTLRSFVPIAQSGGLRGRAVEVFVLPYATWLTLLAMGCFGMLKRNRSLHLGW